MPLTVTASAARIARAVDAEVDVHVRDVGRGQVVDGDRVDPAQRVEREDLDVVGIHDDVADVAGEQQPAAVGGRGEDLRAGEPLKSSVSVPAWPSTMSLPSPGSQTKVSFPLPMKAVSLPPLPSIVSLPSPPMSVSAPLPPLSVSLPSPPSSVSCMSAAEADAARERVVAAQAVDVRRSLAASDCGDVHLRRQAGDLDDAVDRGGLDRRPRRPCR